MRGIGHCEDPYKRGWIFIWLAVSGFYDSRSSPRISGISAIAKCLQCRVVISEILKLGISRAFLSTSIDKLLLIRRSRGRGFNNQ